MRTITLILAVSLCFFLASCGKSIQQKVKESEKKSKSDVRMKILDQYNACIKKADGDAAKVQKCKSLLKASEKVK